MITTPGSGDFENSFVSKKLPRLIGVVAILLYFITLSHWITLGSLENVSRMAGWHTQPALVRPLAWTLFAAFRFLPDAWIPLAANLFTALSATLVLVLLTRCVALLRYDVLPEGGIRKTSQLGLLTTPSAWMPPVFAALIFGLQLDFWEHATAATGEMPMLVLFAYAIRCLLEFRITKIEAWLGRGILAYGAGMADSWVLIACLPVLVAALIGLKGLSPFLSLRFLLRMTLLGLAGMLLCLLLPTLETLWSAGSDRMWATLLAHFKAQKQMLWFFKMAPFRLLALTGLIPFLILSVRWKSHTIQPADDTPQGVFVAKVAGHFIHALLLVLALWIALEPELMPRGFPSGGVLLVYHFIWSMAAGYCAGYVLLFKQGKAQPRPSRLTAAGIRLLLLATVAVLLWKNFSSIRLTNSSATRDFVKAIVDDLPSGNIIVLSDEPWTSWLLQGELSGRGRGREVMVVDTTKLPSQWYSEQMAATFQARWSSPVGTNTSWQVTPAMLVSSLTEMAAREPTFYAHPSLGLFFERYVGEAKGSAQRLVLRASEEVSEPILPGTALEDNERLWQTRWSSHIKKFATRIEAQRNSGTHRKGALFKWLRVPEQENLTAMILGGAYSKALNHWGVELRRAGRGREAMEWFRRALALNPANFIADINLESVQILADGDDRRFTPTWTSERFSEEIGRYKDWWDVLNRNGPGEVPALLMQTGRLLLSTGNPRQAIAAFKRAGELSPNWPRPKLYEAQALNTIGSFKRSLELSAAPEIKPEELHGPGLALLLHCRVVALRGIGRTNEAWDVIDQYIDNYSRHNEVIMGASTLCADGGRFERELELLNKVLSRVKLDAGLLTRRGLAEFHLGRNTQAAETLTLALDLAPENIQARLFRAVAQLRAGQAEAARADFERLLKNPNSSQLALFGLGDMAWRGQDTNAAIRYYEQYMSNNAAATPQAFIVTERLKQMKIEQ